MRFDGSNNERRVDRSTRSGRAGVRLIAIAVMVIAAVGGSVAAALLISRADAPQLSGAGSTAPFAGASGPTVIPSSGPRSITPRPSVEASAVVGNIEFLGSPELVLFQRQGDDLNLLGWRAGESALGTRQVIPGALRGVTEQQDYLSQLSPDGSILLMHARPATPGAPDIFRVFRLDLTGGREIWESTALGSGVGAAFIGADRVVVTSGGVLPTGRGWTIVDLSRDNAVIHELDVPPIPRPSPGTSIDFDTQTFNYVPLAMSADGSWVYAMSVHASEPVYRLAYRIAIETGEAQPLTAFPTTGPSRVVSPLVDPISGRLLLAGPRVTSGSGLLEAWSTGAKTPDFKAAFNNVFSAVWLDDGGVITADYDRLPGPFSFRIIALTATGKPAATLFTAQGTNAALVGVQRGFAGVYVDSTDSGVRTLVVIRLADGAISAVEVREPSGLNFNVGLRP
jgi:hypothetical protein